MLLVCLLFVVVFCCLIYLVAGFILYVACVCLANWLVDVLRFIDLGFCFDGVFVDWFVLILFAWWFSLFD